MKKYKRACTFTLLSCEYNDVCRQDCGGRAAIEHQKKTTWISIANLLFRPQDYVVCPKRTSKMTTAIAFLDLNIREIVTRLGRTGPNWIYRGVGAGVGASEERWGLMEVLAIH